MGRVSAHAPPITQARPDALDEMRSTTIVVAFVTETIRCLLAVAPVLMQMPLPTSALVNAAVALVIVVVPFVTASEPERSTLAEVPPLSFEPDERTYQLVGCCNESAGGPMYPRLPFGVAGPNVSAYLHTPVPTEAIGPRRRDQASDLLGGAAATFDMPSGGI
jgi:hypothetical protein